MPQVSRLSSDFLPVIARGPEAVRAAGAIRDYDHPLLKSKSGQISRYFEAYMPGVHSSCWRWPSVPFMAKVRTVVWNGFWARGDLALHCRKTARAMWLKSGASIVPMNFIALLSRRSSRWRAVHLDLNV